MGSVEESCKNSGSCKCHVVAMPYPGRGHINPMMNLCKLLASRGGGGGGGGGGGDEDDDNHNNIHITFVVTEEWLSFIGSEAKPANIRFRSIPNVIPSEKGRAGDFTGFIEAVATKMGDPFEQLLDQLEQEDTPPVTAIITDTFLVWAVGVGNRRNIPVASLWTMSPSVFSVFHHFDLLVQNGHFPAVHLSGNDETSFNYNVVEVEKGSEHIDYIPGISSISLADLPTVFNGPCRQTLGRVIEAFSWVPKAQCLLLTSFYEVDTQSTDAIRAALPLVPVYTVGPSIPHMKMMSLSKDSTSEEEEEEEENYIKWLASQSEGSVLYVSLGSFHSVSSAQMDEIAAGLHHSGVPFLWIARQDTSRLQQACGDKGLVIPWCDQLRVLCHSSVGGFWSHCGWNSTLESVFTGIPMLTFPIFWDQPPNSKLIADDLRIGWRMKEEVGSVNNKLVKREDIARTVHMFMDANGEETKEMRRRAGELQRACRGAIAKGGSSETNLDAFVRDILQCHP